ANPFTHPSPPGRRFVDPRARTFGGEEETNQLQPSGPLVESDDAASDWPDHDQAMIASLRTAHSPILRLIFPGQSVRLPAGGGTRATLVSFVTKQTNGRNGRIMLSAPLAPGRDSHALAMFLGDVGAL